MGHTIRKHDWTSYTNTLKGARVRFGNSKGLPSTGDKNRSYFNVERSEYRWNTLAPTIYECRLNSAHPGKLCPIFAVKTQLATWKISCQKPPTSTIQLVVWRFWFQNRHAHISLDPSKNIRCLKSKGKNPALRHTWAPAARASAVAMLRLEKA